MQVKKVLAAAAVIGSAGLMLSACGGTRPAAQPKPLIAGQLATTTSAPTTTPAPTTTVEPTTTPPTTTTVVRTTPKPAPKIVPVSVSTGTPCSAAARACVDLTHHQAWLLSGGKVIYGPVAAEPGKPSAPTIPGTFHVLWKDKNHKSSEFNDAPMPYSVFFNSNGSAFHTGNLRVKSNGCVHLSNSAAMEFFDFLSVGDLVQIIP